MKGSQIAGLLIGLIIIIAAIIVIVVLLMKRNKSTKSQEIVIDNTEVQDAIEFSKDNLEKKLENARAKPITDAARSKAKRLYGNVPPSKLEENLENSIPYDYISKITEFNDEIAKSFDGTKTGWSNKPFIKNEKEESISVPDAFSYVLYDTLNGDLKKVYINPPVINNETNEKADYQQYKTLGDFLRWHLGEYGKDEVVKGSRKADIDLNDKRLVKLAQLKGIYDKFVSSGDDNFVDYLLNNQDDIKTRDEARERAEAIIEVLTTSPYEWVKEFMIETWNAKDVNSIYARNQFKHPVIYAMTLSLDDL